MKPVMKLTNDGMKLDKFVVKRTMSSAVKCIMEYLKDKELGVKHILYISHADALEDAREIKALFEKTFQELEIQILELSPVFVAQGGRSAWRSSILNGDRERHSHNVSQQRTMKNRQRQAKSRK